MLRIISSRGSCRDRSFHLLHNHFKANRSVPNVISFSSVASGMASRNMTPDEVVSRLSKFIISQDDAKRALSIALRSRWRRRQLDKSMRQEISPFNILLSGPTGTGKTEISRRLAALTTSPFVKVEATKYTEIGIVGHNTDSMIADLCEISLNMEKKVALKKVKEKARKRAMERVLDAYLTEPMSEDDRNDMWRLLKKGELDHIEIDMAFSPETQKPNVSMFGSGASAGIPPELSQMVSTVKKMLDTKMQQNPNLQQDKSKSKTRRVTIKEAVDRLQKEEQESLVEDEAVLNARAIENAEQNGIVFIDEIDKLAGNEEDRTFSGTNKGEGVQKELLALVEGCTVQTRIGLCRTDHILFIASGAFHSAKPSDLLPELQGRLPIRVTLKALRQKDLVAILSNTECNLLEQQKALLGTEDVELEFTPCAVDELAKIAAQVNSTGQDIGARRLHTVVSKVMEKINYDAHQMAGSKQVISKDYVAKQLTDIVESENLSKYVL